MKLRDFLFAAGVCTAGFAACSKDSDSDAATTPRDIDDGLPTTFTLSVSQPKTYAVDNNATSDELAFNTVDVLIYKGNTLVKHVTLDGNDFTETGSGTNMYTSKNSIETTTGTKEVYVGVNLPADIRSTITATETKGNLSSVNSTTVAALTAASTGFAMFSTEGVESTFVEVGDALYNTNNVLTIPVERLVAKVTVQKDEDLTYDVAGGTLSDLQFGIRNSNKLIYALQQKDSSGTVIDPNYYTADYDADDFEQLYGGYANVDESNTAVLSLTPKYAPENTSASYWTRETTYASIRAKFKPAQFADETGTLYDNTNADAVSFWVVDYNNGDILYFEDKDDADTFAGSVNGTVSSEYKDGYTYYNMFLNPNGKYNTIRNNYYKTTIKSITGLGNPTSEEGGNTPEPVESKTLIDLVIDIVEWQLISDGYDLSI
ncbi:MAG: Mfa1 family fimbria major subunit [Rikenellaceae bacterium]|nr:Mfa1 family fimbria major subunit [Rikenellaceae bacterium]